jgi:hypothetical protein
MQETLYDLVQETQDPIQETQETPSRLIMDLFKLYQSNDKKYTKELYDILDIKLRVFYNCCKKVGLQEDQYYDAFSAMLKDRASDFYYESIIGKTTDIHTIIAMTKAHFETEENRQLYLTK